MGECLWTIPFLLSFIMSVFTSLLTYSELLGRIKANKHLESYQWMRTALRYFGTKEIAGSKSNPLIVQFIASTTGQTYHAQTREGTILHVDGEADLPLVCSLGYDFNRTTRRGRSRHIDEEVLHWCSAFVNHVMISNGYPGTNSLGARSWRRYGKRIKKRDIEDHFGAIAVFSRYSRTNPNAGHVGFYVGETRHHYLLLGGNQGNSVCVRKYRKWRLLGFRWPD